MRLPLFACLMVISMRVFAQTDSLTISDTIGVQSQQRGFAAADGYRYYGASQLTGSQLGVLLRHSPDSLARRLYSQSRLSTGIATGLTVSTLGLFIGSLTTVGRRGGPGGALLLSGYTALFAGFIPRIISQRQLARAVMAHNTRLRTQPAEYLPPVVYTYSPTQLWPLSLTDTIALRRSGLAYRYLYRGIRVDAGRQLTRLTTSLNDREVNEGVRYVRTMGQIGGLVGGIGRGLLTGYVTSLILTSSRRFRRNPSLNNQLLTTGLICVGANFVLSRHANHIQRRWVGRFNEGLRQRFRTQ